MKSIVVDPPRLVPAGGPLAVGLRTPWIEASLRLAVEVPAWSYREVVWRHVALPLGAPAGEAVEFDPSRFAAREGEPGAGERERDGSLTPAGARSLVVALVAGLPAHLLRAPALGAVSALGEAEGQFRRRCLAPLGAALREGRLPGGAATLATLAAVESRALSPAELTLLQARLALAWYPAGVRPAARARDTMAGGAV